MSPPSSAALVLAFAACTAGTATPSAADRTRYASLLADTATPPAAMLRACGDIAHPALRGDCQLAAVGRADRELDDDLAPWCADVRRGRTRDECWFIVAERRRRSGAEAAAAAACGRTGAFEADCARHLWEDTVVGLAAALPPPRWPADLPRVASEIARWEGLLPGVSGLPEQMWARFYERGLSRPGAPLDLRHCRPLPRADADRCHAAGAALYERRLARRADAAGVDLCAQAPRAASWQALVPAAPHPRLDDAVGALVAARCPPR